MAAKKVVKRKSSTATATALSTAEAMRLTVKYLHSLDKNPDAKMPPRLKKWWVASRKAKRLKQKIRLS